MKKRTILVVDDKAPSAFALKVGLETREEFCVDMASSGYDALRQPATDRNGDGFWLPAHRAAGRIRTSRWEDVMKLSTTLALTFCGLTVVAAAGLADDAPAATRARIGEVRLVAIAPGNKTLVSDLHRDGWLEAHGQLLAIGTFPELYRVVGRAWTAEDVAEDHFAVPEISDRLQRRISSDNPFGVLGPGDLVTSGRVANRPPPVPLTCWIFVGRPVTAVGAWDAVGR